MQWGLQEVAVGARQDELSTNSDTVEWSLHFKSILSTLLIYVKSNIIGFLRSFTRDRIQMNPCPYCNGKALHLQGNRRIQLLIGCAVRTH